MSTFGREIKKARIDKGWRQKQLAQALGWPSSVLSDIENDAVEPRLFTALKIAWALGVSLGHLTDPITRPVTPLAEDAEASSQTAHTKGD